jgi:protein involved in sex pheromone biosynthesis
MKKTLLILIMLLSSLLILSACGGESAETGAPTEPADSEITTEEQSAQPVKYAGGDNEYRIIYPDKASDMRRYGICMQRVNIQRIQSSSPL